MCLIITALASLAMLWVHLKADRDNRHHSLTLTLVLSAAALMWTVDRTFAWQDGEAFFDLSLDDLLLGLTCLGCTACLWGVLKLRAGMAHPT